MSENEIVRYDGQVFIVGNTPPASVADGDIWLNLSFPDVTITYHPWYDGMTHQQWRNYARTLARRYAQRIRAPQIARQRRLIKQYGEAYRWPPQYRYPNYRYR